MGNSKPSRRHRRRVKAEMEQVMQGAAPSEWLCGEALKDDDILFRLYPDLKPRPYRSPLAELDDLIRQYFKPKLAEEFNKMVRLG